MRKTLVGAVLASTFLSGAAFAETVADADRLFLERSYKNEKNENGKEAHRIYVAQAESRSAADKSDLLSKASEALYFHGTQMPQDSRGEKKAALKVFWDAYETGVKAAAAVSVDPNAPLAGKATAGNEEKLANAYYWLSASIARWGELKGPFSALGKWRKILKPTLQHILDLKPSVGDYGVYRILGKALLVLRTEVRGKNGLDYIKIGYEATTFGDAQSDYSKLTKNPTTHYYYLQNLRKAKGDDNLSAFCGVYEQFSDLADSYEEDSSVVEGLYGPRTQKHLVPEAIMEINSFKADEKLEEHYDENC